MQADDLESDLPQVIVAMITSNTRLAIEEPTQVLIDITTPDGKETGLALTSAVKCENLYTLPVRIMRKIGTMPPALMHQVDAALKASLSLK